MLANAGPDLCQHFLMCHWPNDSYDHVVRDEVFVTEIHQDFARRIVHRLATTDG